MPVVFSYHGNGGSGESFSIGLLGTRRLKNGSLSVYFLPVHVPVISPTAFEEEPDIEFFKVARAYVLENYSVDKPVCM